MTKRRGSVFQRSGSWGYSFSYTASGVRQQTKRQGFATRKDAEKALTKALSDIDGGRLHGAGKQTVEGYLISWFSTWSTSSKLKPSTVATVRIDINSYLIPVLGSLKLKELKPKHIQDMLGTLLASGRVNPTPDGERGLSVKSVRNVYGTLKQALNDAVRWELLPYNPALRVTPPAWERVEPRSWSAEQVAQFLDHVTASGDAYAPVWRLLFVTGMRRGELLGLRWADVDLVEGILTVRHNRVVAGSRVVTGTPKSRAGNRTLSLDAHTVTALALLKNDHEAQAELFGYWATDLVVVSPTGLPMQPKDFLNRFQKAARAAGLPIIRLHEARHSYATLALIEGVPVHVLSQRLGHAQASTTLNIYAHVLPTADRAAAEQVGSKIQQLLAKPVSGSSVVAASSELNEFQRTRRPETVAQQDTTNTREPEMSAPPGIRSKRQSARQPRNR